MRSHYRQRRHLKVVSPARTAAGAARLVSAVTLQKKNRNEESGSHSGYYVLEIILQIIMRVRIVRVYGLIGRLRYFVLRITKGTGSRFMDNK